MTARAGDHVTPRSSRASFRGLVHSFRLLDVEVALRAALAGVLPLIVLGSLGRIEWTPYAAFGAMTALYGRSEPYRVRVRTVSVAAVLLLGSVALGVAMAVAHAPLWLLTVGILVVIVIGMTAAATAGLAPANPLFFVFAYSVCAEVPTPAGEVGMRLLVGGSVAAFAWVLTMSGWLVRRAMRARSDTLFKALTRRSVVQPGAWRTRSLGRSIVVTVAGALVAGGLATAAGIGHPYWAVVTVIAVLPGPAGPHSTERALLRMVGTALGVVLTACVLLPGPPLWVLILIIGVAQFGAEVLVGRHYGAALVFITPLALTVAHLASPLPVSGLLVDRALETALGAGVGIVLVLATRRRLSPRPQAA